MTVRQLQIAGVVAAMFLCSGVSLHAVWDQTNGVVVASAEDAAIQTLWSKLDDAWNARDAERFSELFTEDGSLQFVSRGQSFETRAAILQQFETQFSRQSPELRHRTEIGESRLIAVRTAAVDGHVEILREVSAEKPTVLRKFAIFAVLQQSGEGDWQIRLLRAYLMPQATDAGANG